MDSPERGDRRPGWNFAHPFRPTGQHDQCFTGTTGQGSHEMSEPVITVHNNSKTKILFSAFNGGDNGIPYDTKWIEPNQQGHLKAGNFKGLSIGAQAQEGGRWLGGDPADNPWAPPGGTVPSTFPRKLPEAHLVQGTPAFLY